MEVMRGNLGSLDWTLCRPGEETLAHWTGLRVGRETVSRGEETLAHWSGLRVGRERKPWLTGLDFVSDGRGNLGSLDWTSCWTGDC
ncbi:hypothetical protein DPMN_066675 [Dreissena polymorpha]|uniref:Uncharacterized protein n=1 Tax=Dreissena polymorpha TaxID=45954 RepID=A0A9D3YWR9_DREPO|nr:hypothetical protein DPMN_066675 [Dreissena polymorpha]